MRKIIYAALFVFTAFAGSASDGLLLKSSFDGFSTIPDYAVDRRVESKSLPPDLQLRMYPNVKGEGNSVCLDRSEFISYPIKNFSPECGTVMFWVAPQNWSFADTKYYHVFFEIRAAEYRFLVYKPAEHQGKVFFYLLNGKKVNTVQADVSGWKAGSWRHFAAVWNKNGMKLYLDGKLVKKAQEKTFAEPLNLPAELRLCSIWINYPHGWRGNPEWKTAYDDIEIYNRCLNSQEIASAYEKYFPAGFGNDMPRSRLTIPAATKPEIDGVVNAAEWKDASAAPVVNQIDKSHSTGFVPAVLHLKYDAGNLYAGIEVRGKPAKTGITQRDGAVWTNDSFDLFIRGTDGKTRQFAVNSDGALYDSLDGDGKWNSSASAAAKRAPDGWTAEIAIPLSDLGNPKKGSVLRANFGSTAWTPYANYHTWSRVWGFGVGFCTEKFFGDLIFGSEDDAVRCLGLGDLGNARLNLMLKGNPALFAAADWLARDGKTGKPAGNLVNTEWNAVLPPGQVIICSNVKNRSGNPVYAFAVLTEAKQPMMLAFACFPAEKRLTVKLDLSAAGKSALGKTGRVLLAGVGNGKAYAEKNFTADSPELSIDLPFDGSLPENSDFKLRAVVDTVPEISAEKLFRTPDMKQFAPVAVDESVPSPWFPPRILPGNRIEVADRIYSFASGPLPSRIVSRGQAVLEASPNFILNGQPVKWNPAVIVGKHGDRIDIAADGVSGNTGFECRGELWFDGMYKFTVKLLPPPGGLKINELKFAWKTPADAARYVLSTIFRPWQGDKLDLDWNTGELHSVMWTTGFTNGLAWWCESDANRNVDPNEKPLKLRRTGDSVAVTFDIVTIPVELRKTAAYTMVFQGTPPRRPEPFWRNRDYGISIPNSNFCVGQGSGGRIFYPFNFRHYTSMIPEKPAEFKRAFESFKKRGIPLLCYAFPPHLSRFDREYDVFFRSWATTPGVTWGGFDQETGEEFLTEPCCSNTPASDLFVGRVEKLFKEYPALNGVYYDISHVVPCDNPHHGHGGIDAFGKKFSSSNAVAMRSYFLRVYKLHRQYGKYMLLHAHNKYFPFVHDFADAWAPGEEQFSAYSHKPEYYYLEEIAPEEYQSAWNTTIRGVGVQMIPQQERACILLDEMKKHKSWIITPETVIRSLSAALLYDFKLWESMWALKKNHPLSKIRGIKNQLDMPAAVFHGYWTSDTVRSNSDKVRVSWYEWPEPHVPYRRLLVVVNTGRTPQKAAVAIDWKKFGIEQNQAQFRDLWNDRDLSFEHLSATEIPGNHFLFIGVK